MNAAQAFLKNERAKGIGLIPELIKALQSAQSASKHGRHTTFEKKLRKARKLIEEIDWRVFNVDSLLADYEED